MIIRKKYKFYAAHRNEELRDKCQNLHGHRYGLTCYFDVERAGSISTLFGDFDSVIEPFLKQEYDHALLINRYDSLYQTMREHAVRTGEQMKLKILDRPTSVENLAHSLFTEIVEMGFNLNRLDLKETDTSTVEYTRNDWVNDNRMLAASMGQGGTHSTDDVCDQLDGTPISITA